MHYHHDDSGRLWSETDGQGNPIRDYIWMGDIPVAMVDYTGVTERVTYLHADHLNTPRYATDETGTLVWQWSSDAFGNGAPNQDPDGDGTAITLNLRFPGQYYDAESGLHYNWNRYYDPEIGRYITSDPIGLDGGLNTFGYVYNNPLIYIDPLGLSGANPWDHRWATPETNCSFKEYCVDDYYDSVPIFMDIPNKKERVNPIRYLRCFSINGVAERISVEMVCGTMNSLRCNGDAPYAYKPWTFNNLGN